LGLYLYGYFKNKKIDHFRGFKAYLISKYQQKKEVPFFKYSPYFDPPKQTFSCN